MSKSVGSGQWTVSSEFLPDDETTVLCFSQVSCAYEIAYHVEGEWRRAFSSDLLHGITHWMHLPEEP
jgi:hypothetical protein